MKEVVKIRGFVSYGPVAYPYFVITGYVLDLSKESIFVDQKES